ncbi:MAG: hypothetical protein SGI87_01885 [Flavobacteriales bacterium]|nr:hypothetical protein [Flavobacteriales bacterium]
MKKPLFNLCRTIFLFALIALNQYCAGQLSLSGVTSYSIECGEPTPTELLPEVQNTCGTYSLSYSDTQIGAGPCLPENMREWVAYNTCGDSTEFVQVIEYIDTTVPALIYQPAITHHECAFDPEAFPYDVPIFEDCTGYFTIHELDFLQIEPCSTTVFVTYSAIDGCGNMNVVSWIETFSDTLAPMYDLIPPTCENCTVGEIDQYPMFHDNCETGAVVTYHEWVPLDIFSTELRWTLTDGCGNE